MRELLDMEMHRNKKMFGVQFPSSVAHPASGVESAAWGKRSVPKQAGMPLAGCQPRTHLIFVLQVLERGRSHPQPTGKGGKSAYMCVCVVPGARAG